jgi:hypothetical protein
MASSFTHTSRERHRQRRKYRKRKTGNVENITL